MASQYTNFSYPVFEAGQTLKSKDLNNLVDYLETHDRLTRAYLIGSGIFYGLEWTFKDQQLCIEKGAGVSSEGYLFAFSAGNEKGDEVSCCFNLYEEVTMNELQFNSYPKKAPNNTDPNLNFDLYELKSISSTKTISITEATLEGRCLVLFWEALTKDRKTCIDTCDGVGSDEEINIRFFLMTEADLGVIWRNMASGSQGGGGEFSSLFPYLKRLHKARQLDEMIYPADLYNAWGTVVLEAIETPVPVGSPPNTSPTPGPIPKAVISAFAGKTLSATTEASIYAHLKALYTAIIAPGAEPHLQYLNDYLCDLIATINEIAALNTSSVLTLCPDESFFPTFISLGRRKDDTAEPNCRMPFYRLPLEGSSDSQTDKLDFLQKKLMHLIEAAEIQLPQPSQVVRISGSHFKSLPLSEQAIPYYYKDPETLRKKWNYELTKAKRQALIQYYETPGQPYPRDILCYDLKGETFFRIEGHIGKHLSDGITDIEKLRKDLNLPFKLVVLRLSTDLNINYNGADPQILSILNQMQFSQFAKDHPGMEHMAGVPTGGTFIVVFKEEIPAQFENVFAHQDNTPTTVEVFLPNIITRTIIADFCLPYGCYIGPNIEYKFEEEIITPDHCRAEADFEEKQIKDLTYTFENRSPLADTFKWEIFRAINGNIVGSAMHNSGDLIPTKPAVDWDALGLKYTFPHPGEYLIQLTAFCKDDKLTDVAQKVLILCPEEEVAISTTNADGTVLESPLELIEGDDRTFVFIGSPQGGVWNSKDLKFQKIKVDETEDQLELNFTKALSDPNGASYLIHYQYPCEGAAASFEVRIFPSQGVNPARVAMPPANPSALSLQTGYQLEANDIADSTLKSSSPFKKAMNFLQTPPPDSDDVFDKFDDTVAKLLTAIETPGKNDPAKLQILLKNVTYLFLDRLVLETDAEKATDALAKLKTLAESITAQKVTLTQWQGNKLQTKENESTIKAIQELL